MNHLLFFDFSKSILTGVLKKIGDDILLFSDTLFDSTPKKEMTATKDRNTKALNLLTISIKKNLFWVHSHNKHQIQNLYSQQLHRERDASPKTNLLQHQKTVSENTNHYKNIIENGPWIVVKFFSDNSVEY